MKTVRIKLNLNFLAILLVLFFMALAQISHAQKLEISTMVQQTVRGLQKGLQVDYRTNSGWGAGVFFQASNRWSLEESTSNYPFYGIDVSAPIKTCGDLQLLAHVKAGLVNQNFLIATPELETRFRITKFLILGLGAGYRSRQAALSAKLILTTI